MINIGNGLMKQKLVEIIKRTQAYDSLRAYLYSTNIRDYHGNFLLEVAVNEQIKSLIESREPFMVSRMGSTELSVLKSYKNGVPYSEKQNQTIQDLSGFFPVNKFNLDNFCDLYFEAIKSIDVLGIWMNPFEEVIANEYCPTASLTKLRSLEPYFSAQPWSSALKGKKVLVIHPFSESIEQQYAKREKIFENQNVLPEFKLLTYKAVQSLGGTSTYNNWFDALEGMQQNVATLDFDVAIIGAGAYGLPLAAFIKSMGKSAIHLGGATQLLFGIYGRRWENKPSYQNIINQHWARPLQNEKPAAAKKVENSCYW
jgi:hypothetical protein